MNNTQETAFKAGTAGASSSELFFLCASVFSALLFLWAAWVLIDAYNGTKDGYVKWEQFGFICFRLVMVIILGIAIYIG